MHRTLNFLPRVRFALIAAIAASLSLACGGSATTSGDHNVGAGASAGEGATGGSGSTGAQAGIAGTTGRAVRLAPGSWQMTGVVTEPQVNNGVTHCDTLAFTLNVAPDGSSYLATIGHDGFMDSATAEITNGSYVLGGLYLPCGISASGLTLQGTDANADGNADGLSGTLSGMAHSGGGDEVVSVPVQIELTGVPDVTAPTLVPRTDPVNPLVAWTIDASEPLAAGASLELAGMPNLPLAGTPATGGGGVPLTSLIEWSTNVILPLSGHWAIQGTGQDLSGLTLQPTGELDTLPEPGIFAQDGFEGPLVATSVSGELSIVTGVGRVPAISGAHSLWLIPGAVAMFHLNRANAEQTVSFSARAFAAYGVGLNPDVRAGVVGGRQIVVPTTPISSGTAIDTGDAHWAQASEVEQFSVTLSEPGTDVLLQMTPHSCSGFCGPSGPVALMIDDLTLE